MVAENTKKTPQESASVQPTTKHATPKKPTSTTPVKQTKPAPPPSKKPSKPQQESNPQEEGNDPDLELAKKLSLETHQEKGEGEGDDADLEQAIKLSLDLAFLPQGRAPVGGVEWSLISSSSSDSERTESDTESGLLKGEQSFQESHSGSMSSLKNLDDTVNFGDQFLHDQPTEDDQEKSKAREEFDSNIPDSSHQTVTSTPPLIAPFTNVTSSEPSLLVTPPPINTEATTITTSLPEITPFIALQLRVAKLEQEMSEVKKTDVLASIRSQVPTAVDNYLGTKLDDALLKVLERHTADLIEKYSVLPGPESVKNQESEKLRGELFIKAKKGTSLQLDQTRAGLQEKGSHSAHLGQLNLLRQDDDKVHRSQGETLCILESDASFLRPNNNLFSPQTLDGRSLTQDDTGADSSMHRSVPESETL
ncbi:hypothetical protein Tco_0755287 [Tanacetum coccineum]